MLISPFEVQYFFKKLNSWTRGAASEVEICNYRIPQAALRYEPHFLLQYTICLFIYLIPPLKEI